MYLRRGGLQPRRAAWALGAFLALPMIGPAVHSHPAAPSHPRWGSSSGLPVIPFPGTPDAAPSSQIIFSGLPPSGLRWMSVRGTHSGVHEGRLTNLPDGAGAAFVPDHPFSPGEVVHVRAVLRSGRAATSSWGSNVRTVTFSFRIALPGPTGAARVGERTSTAPSSYARASRHVHVPTQHFRSAPGLRPPMIHIRGNPDDAAGDIFITPHHGPPQGPTIINGRGQLVWERPIHAKHRGADNLEVARYHGQPVLTWWQGRVVSIGYGADGEDVIMNRHYRTVAILHAANGYSSDLHEFQVTSRGTALVDAYVPVTADMSSVGGPSNGTVLDCVIQELDIKTGRLLWEWHALGHVPLSASYEAPGDPYDFFHLNSIEQLPGGNLLVSARNTWAVYEISRRTGRVIWTLGGKYSSFRMGPGTGFEWQHDAHLSGHTVTLFDDAWDGLHQEARQSSALVLTLHRRTMRVALVHRYTHSPPLLVPVEGSAQLLAHGRLFVGWGATPDFSEYAPGGRQIFNGSFPLGVASYRAYRFPWQGQPLTRPAQATVPQAGGALAIFASWNGATQVRRWRVLGGDGRASLAVLATAPAQGFETQIKVQSQPRYVAVQALGADGHVLRSSRARPDPAHVAIFGWDAFASAGDGVGAIPVGCVKPRRCVVRLTIASSGTVLARSPLLHVPPRSGALVPFHLSSGGLQQLDRHRRLGVQVTLSPDFGHPIQRRVSLIAYQTSGPGPQRNVSQSPTVQIADPNGFVSPTGHGTILVACYASAACHAQLTLTAQGQQIAHTEPRMLGADELQRVPFALTHAGHSLLAGAPGNQLPANARLTDGSDSATGQIALIAYR